MALLIDILCWQVRWCGQVFEGSDSSLLLSQLVAASLASMDPPVDQVVAAAVKQQEQPLDFLIAVKTAGDNFLKDLEDALGTAKQGKFYKHVHKYFFPNEYH